MTKQRSLADAIFRPRSVALVGLSSDAKRASGRILPYLTRHGYEGRILPVNPRRERIGGLPCYPDLASAPGPVEHAFILLNGEAALRALEDCADAGVRCASILAGGFADAGAAGAKLQERMVGRARAAGMRLIGPNSIGTIDTNARLALSVNAVLEMEEIARGRIGVLSHSGSLIGALLARGQARGLGFSRLVSVGNEADLGMGEIGEMLIEDAQTDVILLFVETIRNRNAFAAMARRAHDAGKPLLAFRLGRSAAGSALAASHTGALTGGGAAVDALLEHLGIARIMSWDALVEAAPLFAGRAPRKSAGKRVAVLATTGGGGAMVVDRLGEIGVETAAASPAVRRALACHGIAAGHGGLIDLTIAGARPEVVSDVVSAVIAEKDVAAVVMAVGSSAQFHPQQAIEPLLRWAGAPKPLCAYLVPEAMESQRLLMGAGIAAFRTPEACADAVRALIRWRAPVVARGQSPRAAREHLAALGSDIPDEAQAQALFAALGIPHPRLAVIRRPADAPRAARSVGFPCAVKVLSPDIVHKTESGGVALGIADEAALAVACRRILRAVRKAQPKARIDGLLVQRMAEGGLVEAIVGYRNDPVAGPTVTLGVGGILAELYRDVSVRIAPVGARQAREMIQEVTGFAPIRGWRGMPKGDLDALAGAVVAISRLAFLEAVTEAEINPLIVLPAGKGVAAVDGLIRLAPARARRRTARDG